MGRCARSLQVLLDQVLEEFLTSRTRLRIDAFFEDVIAEVGEARLSAEDLLAELAVPARIAVLDVLLELAVGHHLLGDEHTASEHIHASDVRVKEIRRVDALTPQLGVEVHTAAREAARRENLVANERDFLDVVRKLIGIPTEQRIASVHVDAAEDAVVDGVLDLVLEAMAAQDGVVRFDVDAILLLEAVALEERVH